MTTKRINFRIPEQLLLPWSPGRTISVTHAARMLDVSPNTIWRLIEDGTLKAYKKRPHKKKSPWLVFYDSVVAYAEQIHEKYGLEKRF